MMDAATGEFLLGVLIVLVAVGMMWTWWPMLGAGIALVVGNVL